MSNVYENNINVWGFDSDNIKLSDFKTNTPKTNDVSNKETSNKDKEQDVKLDEIKLSISKNEELDKKQQEQLDTLTEKLPNINVEGNSLIIK